MLIIIAIFDMDITTTQPTEIRDYSTHSMC